MVAAIQVRTRGVSQTEEYVPTHTVSQPDPQWYLAKMRDLYERDPQLLDPSWRAYFATETAPPQLRAKRPAIPEGAIEDSAPEQTAPTSSMRDETQGAPFDARRGSPLSLRVVPASVEPLCPGNRERAPSVGAPGVIL